ncbi:MAG TPA: hypothetical protein PK959_06660 [Candidatus Competibacteraceae bacterium]|nr:hypothetical protein [Candidatus Competibacteraceae bacterium]
MSLEELLELAKTGYFDRIPSIIKPQQNTANIPFEKIKAEALQNPEVRAEYERLRPEFTNKHVKKTIHRYENGQRIYLMDYINDKKLYAAVMFAREKYREGESQDYAIGMAAKKYRVDKCSIAYYVGQVGGTVSGRRR